MDARAKSGRSDRPSARLMDHAARGDDDPAAVLLADGVDAAQPRHDVALVDLDDAHAAFAIGGAAADLAYRPPLDAARRLQRLGEHGLRRRDRAGGVPGRIGVGAPLEAVERLDRLGEPRHRLRLRALHTLHPLADFGELLVGAAMTGVDIGLQGGELHARLDDLLLQRVHLLDAELRSGDRRDRYRPRDAGG